jgi:hypothetical protein
MHLCPTEGEENDKIAKALTTSLAPLKGVFIPCPILDPRVRVYFFQYNFEYGTSSESAFCTALKVPIVTRRDVPMTADPEYVSLLVTFGAREWTHYGWMWDEPMPEEWELYRKVTISWRPAGDNSSADLCHILMDDNQPGWASNAAAKKDDADIEINSDEMARLRKMLNIRADVNDVLLIRLWLAVAACADTRPLSAERNSYGKPELTGTRSSGCLPCDIVYQLEQWSHPEHGYTGTFKAMPMDTLAKFVHKTESTDISTELEADIRRGMQDKIDDITAAWQQGDLSAQVKCCNRYLVGQVYDEGQFSPKENSNQVTAGSSEELEAHRCEQIDKMMAFGILEVGAHVQLHGLQTKHLNGKTGVVLEFLRTKNRYCVRFDDSSKTACVRPENLMRARSAVRR